MQGKQSVTVARQRRQLAQWLYEWRLDQALPCPEEADEGGGAIGRAACPQEAARAGDAVAPTGSCHAALQAGEVRLLKPVLACARARPIYLLLLTQLGDGAWLVAPFGRFFVPALPGEWRTGLRALHVGVLCGWHVRRVAAPTLVEAWHAMALSDAWLAVALRLAAACCDSPELDAAVSATPLPWAALGPPLRHPADPRRAYLAAEADRLDELGERLPLRGSFAFNGQPDGDREPLRYPTPSREDLLLAAEKRDGHYGDR